MTTQIPAYFMPTEGGMVYDTSTGQYQRYGSEGFGDPGYGSAMGEIQSIRAPIEHALGSYGYGHEIGREMDYTRMHSPLFETAWSRPELFAAQPSYEHSPYMHYAPPPPPIYYSSPAPAPMAPMAPPAPISPIVVAAPQPQPIIVHTGAPAPTYAYPAAPAPYPYAPPAPHPYATHPSPGPGYDLVPTSPADVAAQNKLFKQQAKKYAKGLAIAQQLAMDQLKAIQAEVAALKAEHAGLRGETVDGLRTVAEKQAADVQAYLAARIAESRAQLEAIAAATQKTGAFVEEEQQQHLARLQMLQADMEARQAAAERDKVALFAQIRALEEQSTTDKARIKTLEDAGRAMIDANRLAAASVVDPAPEPAPVPDAAKVIKTPTQDEKKKEKLRSWAYSVVADDILKKVQAAYDDETLDHVALGERLREIFVHPQTKEDGTITDRSRVNIGLMYGYIKGFKRLHEQISKELEAQNDESDPDGSKRKELQQRQIRYALALSALEYRRKQEQTDAERRVAQAERDLEEEQQAIVASIDHTKKTPADTANRLIKNPRALRTIQLKKELAHIQRKAKKTLPGLKTLEKHSVDDGASTYRSGSSDGSWADRSALHDDGSDANTILGSARSGDTLGSGGSARDDDWIASPSGVELSDLEDQTDVQHRPSRHKPEGPMLLLGDDPATTPVIVVTRPIPPAIRSGRVASTALAPHEPAPAPGARRGGASKPGPKSPVRVPTRASSHGS